MAVSVAFLHIFSAVVVSLIFQYISFSFFSSFVFFQILLYVSCVVFIGTRFRALGNMVHECVHRILLPTQNQNDTFGQILSHVLFLNYDLYKVEHRNHHRYLGEKEKDKDFECYLLLKKWGYWSLFTPRFWLHYLLQSFYFDKSAAGFFYSLVACLFYLFLLIAVSSKVFFFYVVIPYVISYQSIKIFSDLQDHGKIYDAIKRSARSANHPFKWKIMNLIFFPRNDAFHQLHHLYPSVPLAKLEKKGLKDAF